METNVLHQPRVAFDAARALVDVSSANNDLYMWYADQLATVLGPSYVRQLQATRSALTHSQRADTRNVETGKWRVRLEDVLRTQAGVGPTLRDLTLSAATRLADSR